MSVFLLYAILGLSVSFALADIFSGDDDTGTEDTPAEPDPDPDPDPDPETPGTFLVASGTTITGTEGDDLFQRDPNAENYASAVIDAGAGDDVLALYDPEADAGTDPFNIAFDNAEIDAGDGNDLVDVVAPGATILGGAGDDILNARGFAGDTQVFGGDGDDRLFGELEGGDSAFFDGGAGNDTIDARLMENVGVRGGVGDDTILVSGANQPGAGYVISADGGDGDDTIRYEGTGAERGLPEEPIFSSISVSGGEGSDTFEIAVTEGRSFDADPGLLPEGTDTISYSVIRLPDFTPGVDRIEVDAGVDDDSYSLTEATLQEGADSASTVLTLRYEAAGKVTRDLAIGIGASGVEWDDIDFVGIAPGTLVPLT